QRDLLERLVVVAVVEQPGADASKAVVTLRDHDVHVLDLDVLDLRVGVVRPDLAGPGVVPGTAGRQGGDREGEDGRGDNAASKAAAHGGGISLRQRPDRSGPARRDDLSVASAYPRRLHRTRPGDAN